MGRAIALTGEYTVKHFLIVSAIALGFAITASGHVGDHPSVHDTTQGILLRMIDELPEGSLRALGEVEVLDFMTEDERHILAEEHWSFDIDAPATVYVIRDKAAGDVYWLHDGDWRATDMTCRVGRKTFEVWSRSYEAGTVGLGVNSLADRGDHYFVAVRPKNQDTPIEISNLYPGQHTEGTLEKGARVYVDEWDQLAELPPQLEGSQLLRGVNDSGKDGQLLRIFRPTDYVATADPDQILMTWTGDPKTTQTFQWRTDDTIGSAVVHYHKGSKFDASKAQMVAATTEALKLPMIMNDPINHRHVATLSGLEAGETYSYVIADAEGKHRSAAMSFTTAPAETVPFSFIYMGDAQNGLDTWGNLVQKSYRDHPESDFYVMAGDLVDRGNDRDDWDSYFANSEGIFGNKQMIAVPGNHEYQGGSPDLYLKLFNLPDASPVGEKAYTIQYSNALFVMLDSNIPAETQTAWLEEQLRDSDAIWKFVVYHHPVYSSSPGRNNSGIRKEWAPLFDKYHVDVALQGHDHAYLRTWPMNNEKRVSTPAEGTIYIVSVSGTKFYDQGDFDYTEFGMTNTATFQLLDLTIDGDKLTYRSFDVDGNIKDDFVIEK